MKHAERQRDRSGEILAIVLNIPVKCLLFHRFTQGAFSNQIKPTIREPRLLIVTDPLTNHQPVTEASYLNIHVIAYVTPILY